MTGDLDHLTALRREGSRFSAVLGSCDLAAPVAACGTWTLADLCRHLGRVYGWATANVRGGGERGTRPADPAPGTDLRSWYDARLADLVDALADLDRPTWTFVGPAPARWWARRQALETLVHRVDAEDAAGARTELDPVLAADGVAEVVDVLHPAKLAAGGTPPPVSALVLQATDGTGRWVVPGPTPAATVSGPAPALLLLVWGRTTLDDPLLQVDERERAAAVLGGALTP